MITNQIQADIQLKMNNLSYLWNDNFRPDLDRFLKNLSAFNEPSLSESLESQASFNSLFFMPKKQGNGYGLNKSSEKALDEPVVNNASYSTIKPR